MLNPRFAARPPAKPGKAAYTQCTSGPATNFDIIPLMQSSPRFLVTAGNTRERIDRVRDWGNIFTGNTGLAIARALADIGRVDLLTSNRVHLDQLAEDANGAISATGYLTHAELRAALSEWMERQSYAGIFMTAAVSDYRPAGVYEISERQQQKDGSETWTVRNVQAGKISSRYDRIAVVGEPTEKLVDLFRSKWRYRGLLVKFKLEVGIGREQLLRVGQESRRSSGADYLVANTLDMVQGENPGAFLLSEAGEEWVPRADLARRMASLVQEHT